MSDGEFTYRTAAEETWRIFRIISEFVEGVDELRGVFGAKMFQTLIHYDDVVAEAPIIGLSVLESIPRHPIAKGYRALAEEIMNGGRTA